MDLGFGFVAPGNGVRGNFSGGANMAFGSWAFLTAPIQSGAVNPKFPNPSTWLGDFCLGGDEKIKKEPKINKIYLFLNNS